MSWHKKWFWENEMRGQIPALQVSHSEQEQRVAYHLYQFGSALKAQDEHVSDTVKDLHEQLNKLISMPRFTHLAHLFSLSSAETKLLALVYIQAQDPDVIAPFLGLSWFEQGPFLSLDKLATLIDDSLNKYTTIADFGSKSALFKWGLVHLSNESIGLQSAVIIAPYLHEFLQCGTTSCEHLSLLTIIETAQDPVFDSCYSLPKEDVTTQSLLILASEDEDITAWYAQQLALRFDSKLAYYTAEPSSGVNITHIMHEFACLQLVAQGQPILLYWPEISDLLQHNLIQLNSLIEQCKKLVLITPKAQPLLGEIFSQTLKIVLPTPTLSQLRDAWLSLYTNEKSSYLDITQAQQLVAKYPVALSHMKQLANKAKTEKSEDHDYWKTLQTLCFVAQSQYCDELAKLCQARFTLNDMVLNDKIAVQLQELIARVNFKSALQQRLPSFHQGCKALFWGKPGTGKSMAAEAIAGELQLPLYMVNLANIASKWIGETEKHLAKLFDSAERNNAVLMFDEADAIFAKRSEVESSHDKNANMGVSYLLQRMEHYSGLLLLSTNFKSNLDEAFLRRFHGVIEFTLPTEQERVQIWTRHLNSNADIHLQQGIEKLATLFELSAAQIINICEVALLQSLMLSKPLISRDEIAIALHRELSKQHAGFMAQQSLTNWLNGDTYGSHAYI